MNPCEYTVVVFKEKRFQGKHFVRSNANFIRRNVKSMTFKALPKTADIAKDLC